MQSSGMFPALNASLTGGAAPRMGATPRPPAQIAAIKAKTAGPTSGQVVNSAISAQKPYTVGPSRRRKQLTAEAPKLTNALSGLGGMAAKALGVK